MLSMDSATCKLPHEPAPLFLFFGALITVGVVIDDMGGATLFMEGRGPDLMENGDGVINIIRSDFVEDRDGVIIRSESE